MTEKVYIGGWFQRTLLHLNEIYDFLASGTSALPLCPERLADNRAKLGIKDLAIKVDGFEYIIFATECGIAVKIFEDGLIVLSCPIEKGDFKKTADILTEYYEKNFSPALSYIFSLGAPVPKELANIKTVYPYFVVLKNSGKHDGGDTPYEFLDTKKIPADKLESYIQETMFFREFKGQLHRYLNLHRTIWEEISQLKEKSKVKEKEITQYTARLEDYYKTINHVETRINQMGTYLKTREKVAKDDPDFLAFLGVMEYRYETLGNSLAYIQEIWTMTKNYVTSAKDIYSGLQNKITQRALGNLTIVQGVMAAATIIGLLQLASFNVIHWWGALFGSVAIIAGYSVIKFIQYLSRRGKFKITD